MRDLRTSDTLDLAVTIVKRPKVAVVHPYGAATFLRPLLEFAKCVGLGLLLLGVLGVIMIGFSVLSFLLPVLIGHP